MSFPHFLYYLRVTDNQFSVCAFFFHNSSITLWSCYGKKMRILKTGYRIQCEILLHAEFLSMSIEGNHKPSLIILPFLQSGTI